MKLQIKKIALLAACSFAMPMSWAQLTVTNLRIEHMENPSVVDVQNPRMSWINETKKAKIRGQKQTAYQIGVASTLKNLKAGRYDVWDSGKIASEASSLVPYGGPALQSGKDYYWRVRTWDVNDKASAWSIPHQWGMGLLKASEWQAKWIASNQNDGGAPLLRKSFELSRKISKAKAFICGLGFFELYVNGQRIGEDYLVPNLSNYTHREGLEKASLALEDHSTAYRVLYMAYDVTQELRQGKNAVGVMLGNGFYEPDKHIAGRYGHPCLICQIEITYDDGRHDLITTDGSWLTHPSVIKYGGIYQGETYDARAELNGWADPECNESGWQRAEVVAGPEGQLTAQTSPTDKITEILSPKSLKALGEDKYEIDFGKEISGWIRFIDVEGQRGDTLHVNYVSESPQGSQHYIYKGEGKESYAPRFTWFAFSKAIVTGVKNLSTAQLQAEAVNTDLAYACQFSTSNELINTINNIWRRSQLDNMHGCIASDCPHRERLPYTGDGEAACATVMHNFDAAAFYQKWIRDMRDAQDKISGYEPNSAPWQPGCGGGVAWGAALCTMPWEYYVHYGDLRMLQDCYEPMKKLVGYMLSWVHPDGTMFQKRANVGKQEPNYWFNLGDWCPPYGGPKDDLVHTFYLWLCTTYTARTALALGHSKEAAQYEDLASRVKAAFHQKYYDPQGQTYGDFGSNIYALVMGVPEERLPAVRKSLRKEIMETHDGHINTGFLATKYFFETLSDNGLHDVAYTAINKRDFPSFGHWIAQGATTTWEQWDGGNSHNHPMFGSGLTWFYRHLAGVNADEKEPGFRHVVIRPYLTEGLDRVDYQYQSPYGLISSCIAKTSGETTISLSIPVGSHATAFLPTTGSVRESGKSLTDGNGITLKGQKDGYTIVELTQGNYLFQIE